jgi:hypothetical protein
MNEDVDRFVGDYFAPQDRRCLLVAGAGFDPRTLLVAEKLARVMGDRLTGLLIREERGDPAENLKEAADKNEAIIRELIPSSVVAQVHIFADDSAPVAGARIGSALQKFSWPDDITDVVLDLSALSLGVAFPAARFLLDYCESRENLSLHLMISSNPELDTQIISEPADTVMNIRGYAGNLDEDGALSVARIWLPQLAGRTGATLNKIRAANNAIYKTCPILPFPALNPRRADELIEEFGTQLVDEWDVDPRDIIYVSECNPLDTYRTISGLAHQYRKTVSGIYAPQIILAPIGSKVIAAGAMMAAIEHKLTVQYVETLRYDFDPAAGGAQVNNSGDMIVHVWLHGPIYDGYDPALMNSGLIAPN